MTIPEKPPRRPRTPDEYRNFDELHRSEPTSYEVVVQSRNVPALIVAPHGGGIEPGTTELALAIARDDLSIAVFNGLKKTGNGRLHITSHRFDQPEILSVIATADYVIAIHGKATENEETVYIGGRDTKLRSSIATALCRVGFDAREETNPRLQGIEAANICNRGARNMGVQLELTAGLRRTFFDQLNSSAGRSKPKEALYRFAEAIREGLKDAGVLE